MSNTSTFIVNEYIVNRKRIGKGSFSTIYKGYNTKNNKIYAIKEITLDKKQNKSNVKRELNVLKTLDNPYIVKLHDVIIDTNYNNIYFILDYYPKGDFAKFLNHKPLKEKYCRKYMKQLSQGLEYLLNKDILHRDLKPQNILLTNEYNIKITDFGFAKQVDKNSLITTLCGSPMYMAPEIINKQDYDIKSDLWSVGVILYEMVYGYVPFNVSTFLELIKRINNKEIEYTNKKIKISDDCLELMKSLLTKEPNKRISWEDFFNHKWFINDELLRQENDLMEINFGSYNSIPNINNYKNDRQFCSFTYESYIETKTKSSKENIKLTNSNNDDDINFLESIIDSTSSINDTDSEYISADENDEEYFLNKKNKFNNDFLKNYDYKKSKPINIKNPRTNNDSYEIVDISHIKPQSLPNPPKTVTESLKEYLYSSINLIKQSYNYINSNKSI